jgi:hypothetical protein
LNARVKALCSVKLSTAREGDAEASRPANAKARDFRMSAESNRLTGDGARISEGDKPASACHPCVIGAIDKALVREAR